MRRDYASLLAELSVADIKKLLANMKKIDATLVRKAKLEKELDKIDGELARLLGAAKAVKKARPRRKVRKKAKRKVGRPAKKKAVKKKAAKKKVARKKVAKRKVAKRKVAKRKVAKQKTTRGGGRKRAAKKAGGSKQTLEQVVATLIERNGGPLPFQEILSTITRKKLFTSKSKNFDNVLRRTLSTSSAVKRVGRGVYDLA